VLCDGVQGGEGGVKGAEDEVNQSFSKLLMLMVLTLIWCQLFFNCRARVIESHSGEGV